MKLQPTQCGICGSFDDAKEVYPANLNVEALSAATFSARRAPDRTHCRIVRCNSCGLLRSDPTLDSVALADFYSQSSFDYAEEIVNIQITYGRYLRRLENHGGEKGALLDIGAGSGFVLEEALRQGYDSVTGVEPSSDAVQRADPVIRNCLIRDVMRSDLFSANSFDVITMFQVFDHIPDPSTLLRDCHRILRAGGLVLCLNHNAKALSARLLGERSPIVDVEHTYLYNPQTLSRIFSMNGYTTVELSHVINRCSLRYLAHLFPAPPSLKRGLQNFLARSSIGAKNLWAPLGNMVLIARKESALENQS